MEEWLTEAITLLIPKSEETEQPYKYIQITNNYLMEIITEMMYHHQTQQGGPEAEKKRC